MSKSRYEKMDIMLQDIMVENDVSAKIAEMKEDLANWEGPTGSNKKEFKENKKKDNVEKKKLENKIKFYENYEKNKDRITNIRKYQIEVQNRLENLENQEKSIERLQKDIIMSERQIEELDKKMQKIQEFIEMVEKNLKRDDLTDEERKEILDKKEKAKKLIEDQNASYSFHLKRKLELGKTLKTEKESNKDISNEIMYCNNQISKCNAIWSSLLRGKDWNEIEIMLNTGDFTAPKGTINKIKEMKQSIKSVDKSSFSKISLLNKKRKNNKENMEEKEETSKQEEQENNQEKLPIVIEKFEDRHPNLARIPFLGKILQKRYDKKYQTNNENNKKESHNKNQEENNMPEQSSKQEKISDKEWKFIAKEMEKNQVETFKRIAENGIESFRESMKVDAKNRLSENQRNAAEREANRFGNSQTYQRQQKNVNEQTQEEEQIQ